MRRIRAATPCRACCACCAFYDMRRPIAPGACRNRWRLARKGWQATRRVRKRLRIPCIAFGIPLRPTALGVSLLNHVSERRQQVRSLRQLQRGLQRLYPAGCFEVKLTLLTLPRLANQFLPLDARNHAGRCHRRRSFPETKLHRRGDIENIYLGELLAECGHQESQLVRRQRRQQKRVGRKMLCAMQGYCLALRRNGGIQSRRRHQFQCATRERTGQRHNGRQHPIPSPASRGLSLDQSGGRRRRVVARRHRRRMQYV